MSYWQQFCEEFSGKKVLVFGLGLQGGGVQVANTLVKAGAQVRVSDQKTAAELATSLEQLDASIETKLGSHLEEDINWAEFIIKNPGVPFSHPHLKLALQQEKAVVGETALALSYLRNKSLAVTGTRGKTTTSHLIYHLLQTAKIPSVLAGNIPGKPLLAQLPELEHDTWVVIEIPSFQIESLKHTQTSAHIAVITTLYPDHLNRYETWEEYVQAKTDLFAYQQTGDFSIYQADREWSAMIEASVGTEAIAVPVTQADIQNFKQRFTSRLPGEHNWENIALALKATASFDLSPDQIQQALDGFSGVPFRLEAIATKQGITYINDTTSTTPVALEKALDTLADQPFILIAGGATKNLPLTPEFIEKIASRPTALVLLKGSGQQELEAVLKQNSNSNSVYVVNSLAEAVTQAHQLAQTNKATTVLLSPGYASFEMFANEFDRGEQFNQLVAQLPD